MIYLRLIWSYLKIGFFGFGGGYAMLSLIENEIVSPGWISKQMFTDIVAISQMTPGPIGINSATYIGYIAPGGASPELASPIYGIIGALICTLVVILPSFIIVRYAGHYIAKHKQSEALSGIFKGLRPVVIGLIASAALLLMNGENFGYTTPEISKSIAIAVGVLACVLFTRVHPIVLIIISGLIGYCIF
ncbi:MAG: chromate transporter [Muribaculaceae bacterium]|nr:chromate transporter [Muribaculaceae bacterium]